MVKIIYKPGDERNHAFLCLAANHEDVVDVAEHMIEPEAMGAEQGAEIPQIVPATYRKETDKEMIERLLGRPWFYQPENLPARFNVDWTKEPPILTELPVRIKITNRMVNAEFERRLTQGMPLILTATADREAGSYVVQTDDISRSNIARAALAATIAISKSVQGNDYRWLNPTQDFTWKMKDNTQPKIDAPEMQEIGQQVQVMENALFGNMSDLKALSVIPQDYQDDEYWN